jgi:chloramphenicol 3-O-phosphotransferase
VHKGMSYDLELDSSRGPPMGCANLIEQKFRP